MKSALSTKSARMIIEIFDFFKFFQCKAICKESDQDLNAIQKINLEIQTDTK